VRFADLPTPTAVSGRYHGQTVVEVGAVTVGGQAALAGTITFPTVSPLTPGLYELSVFANGVLVLTGSIEIHAC